MNGRAFEAEVLRVARALWRHDPSGGAELIEGRERDGIFYEEDIIHLVEATIDKSEEKARIDVKKLVKLAGEMRKKFPERVVKCWFITNHEPTDRQRALARAASYPVHAVGFREFQGKLIDAREYIRAREHHRFGSAHSPSDTSDLKFIPIDIKERGGAGLKSISELSRALLNEGRISLTADFGAGKSMVLRELFHRLSQDYLDGKSSQFPVHINLREHSGAQFPDEILERHARVIGFPDPPKLVRAWRAGYVILLLDGFDEITSLGFQGRWSKLREVRYRALQAVRELIISQPRSAGVIVAGREFYFDSYAELKACLGLNAVEELTLNEFSEEQVESLLRSLGIAATNTAPAWFPKRPLFVATLALQGYLADVRGGHDAPVGQGWNELIERICLRESRISVALDPGTIRQVLERVATIARGRSVEAALNQRDLVSAFVGVCGYDPDEQGLLLLERLPGLGLIQAGSEARKFVDPDFECALSAGDVARYFVEPWNCDASTSDTLRPLTSVGVAVAAAILASDARAKNAQPAIDRSKDSSCLCFDVLQVAIAINAAVTGSVALRDLHVGYFEIVGVWGAASQLYFHDCIFDLVEVDPSSNFAEAVRLQGCLVRAIAGVHSLGDLPIQFLDADCVTEELIDTANSNAAILSADLELPVRVMLVVLRKLYMQVGAARRENAFYRGLDANALRYVDDVLDLLGSEGLASREKRGGEPLVVPNRGQMQRVLGIIGAPETSRDPLVVRARRLA